MTLSEDIKAALRIEDEFRRDGHELRKVGVQFVTLCPWHSEKTPSCYISSHKGRFHCFGCGVDGTVIDYTALKRGITPTDAIKELAARMSRGSADSNGRSQSAKPKPPGAPYSPTPRALPKLPLLYNGGTRDLVNLALLRKISVEALRLATSGGLLWFCDLKDGPELVRAWVITDHTRRNAQGRRLDGEHWRHVWGDADAKQWVQLEPARRRKVRGFSGNWASWPMGIEEAQGYNRIALVEGGPDFLAAFHFAIAEGREAVAPVAILGASNRIPNDVLDLFTGKRVRLFPHADAAGLRAAVAWESQLRPVVAYVDAFDLSRLNMTRGKTVKDLNDLTSIDPDCFEREPALQSVMSF